jgi:hypothetical protein
MSHDSISHFIHLFIHSSMILQPFVGHDYFFSFLILYTAGRTRPKAQTQKKRTQTSMLRAGFEPTTPVFKRAKTVHTLDCAATVTSTAHFPNHKYNIYPHTYMVIIGYTFG